MANPLHCKDLACIQFNLFFLALAGLTFFLRQQVVTFIPAGRSFVDRNPDIMQNVLVGLGMDQRLEEFGNPVTEGVVDRSGFGCYGNLGVCISLTAMEALMEDTVREGEIMTRVSRGLAEYLSTGDITNTWRDLREISHVVTAEKCIRKFKTCQ